METLNIKFLNFIYNNIYNSNYKLIPKKRKYLFQLFLKVHFKRKSSNIYQLFEKDLFIFFLLIFYPFFFKSIYKTKNPIIKKIYETFLSIGNFFKILSIVFFVSVYLLFLLLLIIFSDVFSAIFVKLNISKINLYEKQYYFFLNYLLNEMLEFLYKNKNKIDKENINEYNELLIKVVEYYNDNKINIYEKDLIKKIKNKRKISLI